MWIYELIQVDPKPKGRARLAKLVADPRDLAAAQTVVAKFGAKAARMLMVLAFDGSETSADILLPVVHHALKGTDDTIEVVKRVIVPYARGKQVDQMLATVAQRGDARKEDPSFAALVDQLGLKHEPFKLSLQMRSGEHPGLGRSPGSIVFALDLQSPARPLIQVRLYHFGASKDLEFKLDDDEIITQSLKVPKLSGLEALPAWIQSLQRTLHMRWWPPRKVDCTVKGPGKKRLVEWLLGPQLSQKKARPPAQ